MGGSNSFEFHTTRGSLSAWNEAEHGHTKCFEPKCACGPAFSHSLWRRRSLGVAQFRVLTTTKQPCITGAAPCPMAALPVQEAVVSAWSHREDCWRQRSSTKPSGGQQYYRRIYGLEC